jgi:chemotaxis family two-component system response regulator Rcp1
MDEINQMDGLLSPFGGFRPVVNGFQPGRLSFQAVRYYFKGKRWWCLKLGGRAVCFLKGFSSFLKETPLNSKTPLEKGPVEILLVEDNPGDVILVREMMKHSRFPVNLGVTRNGEEALAYLRRQEPFTRVPVPDLVLLDLNLPRKDGREVLEEVKGDPAFRPIPVLILTSSRNDSDIQQAYQADANFYLVKPMDPSEFPTLMKYLEDFWLKNIFPLKAGNEGVRQ